MDSRLIEMLPHGPRMVALETLERAGPASAKATAIAGKIELSRWNEASGAVVPAWFCLELIAQAAAAARHGEDTADGALPGVSSPVRSGMVVRLRGLRLHRPWIPAGASLDIRVEWGASVSDAFSVRGTVCLLGDGALVAEGEVLIMTKAGGSEA